MNETTKIQSRKFRKVLCYALGLMGVVSGGDALCYDARPAPVVSMVPAANSVLADAATTGTMTVTTAPKIKYDAAYSVCQAVVPTSHRDFAIANVVLPMTSVISYLLSHGVSIDPSKPPKITLSEFPTHGELRTEGFANGVYAYYPNENHLGPDQMTFVVEAQGKKFKVIETVWVANVAPEYGGCPANYKLPPAR